MFSSSPKLITAVSVFHSSFFEGRSLFSLPLAPNPSRYGGNGFHRLCPGRSIFSETKVPEEKPDYFLLQNLVEVERFTCQHEVVKDYIGGRLVFAPVDLFTPGLRILDFATADAVTPARPPLVVQSITAPYPPAWRASFDLIHPLPGCDAYPMPLAIRALVSLLKPGGWIQADHSGPASDVVAMRDAFRLIKALFQGMGNQREVREAIKGVGWRRKV
ncbi:MAG: hypothetical protein Q9166_004823 [cf. Caloplaca sp. 2 TL-2023]